MPVWSNGLVDTLLIPLQVFFLAWSESYRPYVYWIFIAAIRFDNNRGERILARHFI